MWTSARTMSTFRTGPSAPLRTVSLTVVPGSPRTRPTVSSRVSPFVVVPSIVRTMSPAWRPAFSAGLPRKTPTTIGRPSGEVSTSAPMPAYEPRERRAPRGAFLGRHELGVAGVADRVGHAVDRGVGELLVVEVGGVDVVLVELVPGLVDERQLVAGRGRGGGGRRAAGHEVRHAPDADPDAERHRERGAEDRRPDRATKAPPGRSGGDDGRRGHRPVGVASAAAVEAAGSWSWSWGSAGSIAGLGVGSKSLVMAPGSGQVGARRAFEEDARFAFRPGRGPGEGSLTARVIPR